MDMVTLYKTLRMHGRSLWSDRQRDTVHESVVMPEDHARTWPGEWNGQKDKTHEGVIDSAVKGRHKQHSTFSLISCDRHLRDALP